MFYQLVKQLLFLLPPEKAHELILHVAHLSPTLGTLSGTQPSTRLQVKVGNCQWKSPLALAAGLDKNAEALDFFAAQGFGAIECGTITLKPQSGNPRPRIFRYPEESSLRNAMGFPNDGLLAIARRLEAFESNLIVGANLGKNKESSPDESIEELSVMMATLEDDADYFVVNVSSPNTPGLRQLQEKSYLTELFNELKKTSSKDLYLKIAPDLDETKVVELAQLASELKLTGLIATNTTIMPERGSGGISGELLKLRSSKIRKLILQQQLPIELIGVGGISSFEDIKQFWNDGGKAVQVYTAYVYQGPELLNMIYREMLSFLDRSGLDSLDDFFQLELKERQKLLN